MLTKPFDQISADNIRDLITRGIYENQLLEFKRELASRDRTDPWLTGEDFKAYPRDHLFREIDCHAASGKLAFAHWRIAFSVA